MKKIDFITLGKLGISQEVDFLYDHHTEWIAEILKELQEAVADDKELDFSKAELTISGFYQRQNNEKYRDFLIVEADVKGSFYTIDVKTGESMVDHLDFEVNSLYLENKHIETYGYEEETSIFHDQKEYEIYPFERGRIELQEMFHEQVFLNRNPYPSQAEENAH